MAAERFTISGVDVTPQQLLEIAVPPEAEIVRRFVANECDNVNEVTVLQELMARYQTLASLPPEYRAKIIKDVQREAARGNRLEIRMVLPANASPSRTRAPAFDLLRSLTDWVPSSATRKAQRALLADEAAEILDLRAADRVWCARWRTACVAIHWGQYLLTKPVAALIRLLFHWPTN